MVSAYIEVNGTWWVKPYFAWPLTPIENNGTFDFDYTTGGIDQLAQKINAYVVTKDYVPQGHTLPDMKDPKVLAGVSVSR